MTAMCPQPKPRPIRNAKFKAFVREHSCSIRGKAKHRCGNRERIGKTRIEAAHIPAHRGIGSKADDTLTIGLCERAHDEQHLIGWLSFQEKYDIDAHAINAELRTIWAKRTAR